MFEYPVRLPVHLANCGVAARRGSEELIAAGRVMVNNKIVRELGTKVNEDDIVQVDTVTVEVVDKTYYIALNKPRGYVCTNWDPNETQYARDLINIRDKDLLFNVGRLDRDSNGLIIFSNDGDFTNKVTHPKFEIEKEYLVHLDRKCEIEDLRRAIDGLYIDMKTPYRIKSYEFVPRRKDYIKVVLTEGKNREIRKIFSYMGYEVKGLTRIRIGCIELGDLEVGKFRNLRKEEIEGLLAGKTSLVVRKKFGAALRRENAEKERARLERKREEGKE